MKYSQEMILQSPSGYCMPFEEREKDVELSIDDIVRMCDELIEAHGPFMAMYH